MVPRCFARPAPVPPIAQPHHVPPAFEIFVRMTVYALADGSIIVYNPIAPTEETLQEIQDAFGDPGGCVGIQCS